MNKAKVCARFIPYSSLNEASLALIREQMKTFKSFCVKAKLKLDEQVKLRSDKMVSALQRIGSAYDRLFKKKTYLMFTSNLPAKSTCWREL